jgi:ribose 5-phosphate isomerase B
MINTDIKKIFIASDHAAYQTKAALGQYLLAEGFQVEDLGTHSEESCHYPVYAKELCLKMQHANSNQKNVGILLCGSGIGVSMVANRYDWIRAARCCTVSDASLAKAHNNANVLCLGSRVNSIEEMKTMIKTWLETNFEGGRHLERIQLFSRSS